MTIVHMFILIDRHNEVNDVTSEIEAMLISEEMQAINELIDYGQDNYNWNSPGTKFVLPIFMLSIFRLVLKSILIEISQRYPSLWISFMT